MKIISTVPSLTEALFDFGLGENEIVGRTKFCIHPKNSVKNVPIIGGTKNLNIEKIRNFKPDLIIANKEENDRVQIEQLQKEFKIWLTDIKNLDDNRTFLKNLGEILGKNKIAEKLIEQTENCFSDLQPLNLKTAYLIWKEPYMTVGNDTFINAVMKKCGLINIFANQNRYPAITIDDLKPAEIILLSTEPFPFKEKHIEEIRSFYPEKKVLLADGEAFSWYGTHLSRRKNYFEKLVKEIRES